MDNEAKRSKERSPAFPFITLERALERVKQFYAEERRGASPLARAVKHWSYSPGSSGALQTIAALKQYGLLEDVGGSGANRQLRLSDLALRIVMDQREDTSERDANLQLAALSPSVAAEVHENWQGGLPSDSTLHHFLVFERKFSDSAATNAVKILKENQRFIPTGRGEVESSDRDLSEEKPVPLQKTDAIPQKDEMRTHGVAKVLAAMASTTEHVVHDDGVTNISITFSAAPTAELYEFLRDYAEFKAARLRRSGGASRPRVKLDDDDADSAATPN